MGEKIERKPPKCPECKELLYNVIFSSQDDYVFDPENGTYERKGFGSGTTLCSECDADVSEVIEDGPENYIQE